MSISRLRGLVLGAAALLVACGEPAPQFHETDPQRLSEWNLFQRSGEMLEPVPAAMVFRPANPLFSDYAQKLRTLWLPDGAQARLLNGEIDYPVGTVLSKTFYYPRAGDGRLQKQPERAEQALDLARNQVLETRLLVRRASGWDALPYVWNSEQTEAFLRVAGSSTAISLHSQSAQQDFVYFVPNQNQCAGCHVTEHPDGAMHPLGAIARQLSASFDYPAGPGDAQIQQLLARGWLDRNSDHATPVSWLDESAPLEARALAYLDMQCGHCHNPEGAADTSALILNGAHGSLVNMGVCKTPVAAGGGAGDMLYSIVPGVPERSILVYRMRSQAPDEMMPELGRSLIHEEGVNLVNAWISGLTGTCERAATP